MMISPIQMREHLTKIINIYENEKRKRIIKKKKNPSSPYGLLETFVEKKNLNMILVFSEVSFS